MRSKTRTIDFIPKSPEELPIWEFDGSSTQQAPVHDSDLYLYPRALYKDPFRPHGNNFLVLCEALDPQKKPAIGNNRSILLREVERVKDHKPWFGFEQEFVIFDKFTQRPYNWPLEGDPPPQGPYYCSIGSKYNTCRDFIQALYNCLLFSGISIYGTNAEVLPSQWEFQIGTCEGIDGADQLWAARYILNRLAEDFDGVISLDPKPMLGNWNGSGLHTNYSTVKMREKDGMKHIHEAIERLSKRHIEHLNVYDLSHGRENMKRLTGSCETASYENFSSSVSGRSVSIRIPRLVNEKGYGYLEDRRPAGNADPYLVAAEIIKTTIP